MYIHIYTSNIYPYCAPCKITVHWLFISEIYNYSNQIFIFENLTNFCIQNECWTFPYGLIIVKGPLFFLDTGLSFDTKFMHLDQKFVSNLNKLQYPSSESAMTSKGWMPNTARVYIYEHCLQSWHTIITRGVCLSVHARDLRVSLRPYNILVIAASLTT